LAHEKDSTTAKVTSAVHVPHKDSTTAQELNNSAEILAMTEEELAAKQADLAKAEELRLQ